MPTTTTLTGFGLWLREAREKRGLTALALAEKSGFSHVTIHNIEHSKRGVKRDTVETLALALCGDGATDQDKERLTSEALLAAGFAVPTAPQDLGGREIAAKFASLPEDRQRLIMELLESWTR